jgi:hypothetical protein
MPYGYYMFVRFAAMVGFAVLASHAWEKGAKTATVIYVALAILFQPLIKIALGRELWNIIDAITGIGLLISIFVSSKNKNN